MTQEEWTGKLAELRRKYPIKLRQRADEACLLDAESVVGELPDHLRSFYKVTNGLRYEWFNLLPIEQESEIAKTWGGLKRANDKQKTKFFRQSRDLLERFLVFAEISAGDCACIDRKDGSIWFQDAEGLHQTDLTLAEFVEVMLREVAEL